MSLNSNLLQLIECPICFKYMRFPIFMCIGGHSICDVCHATVRRCPLCRLCLTNTRNYTLESINELVEFPCDNADAGCTEFVRMKNMNEHLTQCVHRQYNCRFPTCPWKGYRNEFVNHYRSMHREHFLRNKSTNKFFWQDGVVPNQEIYFILVNKDTMFLFHRALIDNTMYFALQYIGKPEDVIQFYFKLRIYTNEYKHREIFISENCNDDITEDVNEILENGYSISVPLSFFTTFAGVDGRISYTIQIGET